jgi:hypothetical protein
MIMTSDFLTPLTAIGVLLILFLVASFITGTIVSLNEALGRIFLPMTGADGSPGIANSTKAAAAPAPITNAP